MRTGPGPATTYALRGRVVTMNADFTVLDKGAVYIDAGHIAAVQDATKPAPPKFSSAPIFETGGTIYPGLIELHNHLSYNALQLWNVPQQFTNRSQWQRDPHYAQLVTGPMGVLGHTRDATILPALVRYVETKCLIAGVTTTQGIGLASNAGARAYYKGILRIAEQPGAGLPKANTHIPDVVATEWSKFAAEVRKSTCLLLHLSEGLDDAARNHFLSLKSPTGAWAITSALTGIHCAGLKPADFTLFGKKGGSMVWSPLSNLLLYGGTADVKAAKAAGVPIALGSDWSPSGSKNLLGELKAAKVWSHKVGDLFSARDLASMVTRIPAQLLKWDAELGTLKAGKLADLLVLTGARADPYDTLIAAHETDVSLVVIDGVPRIGTTSLMTELGATGESVKLGATTRLANFADSSSNPSVAHIPLKEAQRILTDALHRIPSLHKDEQHGRGTLGSTLTAAAAPQWRLALDEQEPTGFDLRPHLAKEPAAPATAPTLPLISLKLDALAVADDPDFLERLKRERNLSADVVAGLASLYL